MLSSFKCTDGNLFDYIARKRLLTCHRKRNWDSKWSFLRYIFS